MPITETSAPFREIILTTLFRTPGLENRCGQLAAVRDACERDADFLAHALTWNQRKGSVLDTRWSVPTLALGHEAFQPDIPEREHLQALLALASPRDLLRAWHLANEMHLSHGPKRTLKHTIRQYLRAREACWPWWEQSVLHFRRAMHGLYEHAHIRPCREAQAILFERRYPLGSVFAQMRALHGWEDEEIAGFLRSQRIPGLMIPRLVGARLNAPAILTAYIDALTPAQFVKRQRALRKLGADTHSATMGAWRAALERVGTGGKRQHVLGAHKAAAAIQEENPDLADILEAAGERAIAMVKAQSSLSPETDVLLCIDKSGSMERSIALGLRLLGILESLVPGHLRAVAFDNAAYTLQSQGVAAKYSLRANGGTDCAAPIALALQKQCPCDVIIYISDGGDYSEHAAAYYQKYAGQLGKEPPLYLFHVSGEANRLVPQWQKAGLPYTVFEADNLTDAGLLSLAQTIRAERYGLIQEILDMPLLRLEWSLRPPRHVVKGAHA